MEQSTFHFLELSISILGTPDIKMRTWSWSASNIKPGQTAWMYRLAWRLFWWQRRIIFGFSKLMVNNLSFEFSWFQNNWETILWTHNSIWYKYCSMTFHWKYLKPAIYLIYLYFIFIFNQIFYINFKIPAP